MFVQSTISPKTLTLIFAATSEPFSEFTCSYSTCVLMNCLMNALIEVIIGVTMYWI